MRTIRIAALLGLTIVAGTSVAHAEQSGKVWRVGFIGTLPSVSVLRNFIFPPLLTRLRDLGYEEGRNIVFEFRSAEGHMDRLPNIATELVALPVDLIISPLCGAPLDAAMTATKTIPIVVKACDDDMVEIGVVASLAHPGGNVTGLSKMTPDLTAKRLDLLKEMVPAASDVAVLWDPKFAASLADWSELRSRASGAGVALHPVEAHLSPDLDEAFTIMTRERVQAVLTFSDVLTYNVPDRVATLAAAHRLPLMSPFRETTKAGGLMSYGPSIPAMVRYTAVYLDKIFKGAKPSELPIERPPKIEMLINLKTAKELGIEVPTGLLVRADEVIE